MTVQCRDGRRQQHRASRAGPGVALQCAAMLPVVGPPRSRPPLERSIHVLTQPP